jgi:cytochrome c-type biogenesis protein CcmF
MASLGFFLLLTAFVVAAYAAAISVAGARRRSARLVESGTGAFYLLTGLMLVASGVIVHAFVVGDYTIKYVQRYSDSTLPLFYKLTSYWGGLDGSIMFWITLLAIFGSVAVRVNRERHRELIPYVVAIIASVEMFFLYLTIIHNNPFSTFLTETHADGAGLNPLLQNFYMVIHPPTMYLGFVGLTIPYAFGMAALITGYLDDSWLRAVRRWTMVSWLFLSVGLGLGMIWAYEELGWGGYWMWDPVENAGALPWFTATAFLHSVMVQERRGMLRVWNVTLVILTFFLTIFGTFMTRSGIVQSVHAFGEDPELARLFGGFMAAILVVSFGFVFYRLPLLKSRNELDSIVSREAAFMVNNWILLVSALFILFATLFPTIAEAVTGERITVGPPFFNKFMLPIGLVLLALTGVGPLLAWRKSALVNLRDSFLWPIVGCLVAGSAAWALGIRVWTSGICFALCGFVTATVAQEFWRGARVRQSNSGTDVLTALVGLVGRNKRRYGGYIVHVGIVLIFFGFAGEGFKQSEQVLLKPGQQTTVGDFTVRLDAVRVSDDDRKQMVTAHTTVFRDGVEFARMYPAKWFFRKHENQPTTEVAIQRGIAQDVYLTLAAFELKDQSASMEININPLVNWIWVGFGVMAMGIFIALLPEQALAFATARVAAPSNAVTSTSLLLIALALTPALVHAQDAQQVAPENRSELQRRLENEILCTCGGCKSSVANCPMMRCHGQERQEAKLREHLAAGKSYDEVIAAFVDEFGSQSILAAPIDRGFNRLAWAVPYAVGLAGLVIIALMARRWTRTDSPLAAAAGGATLDADMSDRLDDELRNLD